MNLIFKKMHWAELNRQGSLYLFMTTAIGKRDWVQFSQKQKAGGVG